MKATGRELNINSMPGSHDFRNDLGIPYDGSQMRNYEQQYQYDELGNILQMKSVGKWTRDYYYDTDTNRLTKHADQQHDDSYYYDAHGNIIHMPHLRAMTWDYQDNFKSADLGGGGEVFYVYDSNGERVRKIVVKQNGIVEERKYLGGYEVFTKTVSGTVETERTSLFISDGNKTIAQIDTSKGKSTTRYQYDNHLGSASLELDSQGGFISYEEYHPFGTTSYRSGKNEAEVSLKRYKYVGKERDEETGFYYYGARYYSSWLGRFVSVDPLQFKFSHLSPYNYASNSPVTHLDIDGMQNPEETDPLVNDKLVVDEKETGQQNEKKAEPVSRVPADEIWEYGKFGAIGAGNGRYIKSKNGKYELHGITEGDNKGNWLVRETFEVDGEKMYKDLFIAGPETFSEIYSEDISQHGRKLSILSFAELMGTDVTATGTFSEKLFNEWSKAWTPENIVANLSLGISALKPLLKKGVVYTADLRLTRAKSRSGHSYAGNKQLHEAMKSDPSFRREMEKILGDDVFSRTSTSNKGRRNPLNFEWDHSTTNRFELDLRSHENHLEKTAFDIGRRGGYWKFYK